MSDIGYCIQCSDLVQSRHQIVQGEGNLRAKLMIIGEAPGEEEDLQGRPFVGRSGKLLNATLAKLGVKREDIYITNVVKCRPPWNRRPNQLEIDNCEGYLQEEIRLIAPRVIVTLGLSATNALLEIPVSMGEANGKVFQYRENIKLIPVYHPSAILRNPNLRESFERALKFAIEEAKK